MEKRFCRNCGAPLEEDATFCVECGKPVSASAGSGDNSFSAGSGGDDDQPKKKNKAAIIAIAALAVLVLAGGISAFLIFGGGGSSESKKTKDTDTKTESQSTKDSKKKDKKSEEDSSDDANNEDETQAVAEEEQKAAEPVDWKQLYRDYFATNDGAWSDSFEVNNNNWAMVDVNGDGIPELLFAASAYVTSTEVMFTIANGQVASATCQIGGGSYSYNPNTGTIDISGGQMDYYPSEVYQVTENGIEKIAEGEYGGTYGSYQYEWNGQNVSEQEYNEIESAYNTVKIDYTEYVTYDTMIGMLQ